MPQKIRLRGGTTAQWATANPILANHEPGVEVTTGGDAKMKVGNGVDHWADLDYVAGGVGGGSDVALDPDGTLTVDGTTVELATVTDVGTAVADLTTAVAGKLSGADGAVTTAKLAANAVTAAKVNVSSVATAVAADAAFTGTYAPIGRTLSDVAATASTSAALVIGKHNPVDASGGARAMTLADATAPGQRVTIEKTDASTNAVTVTLTLRGTSAATLTLTTQYEALDLTAKADGSWWPVAGHRTKSALDAGYAARPGTTPATGDVLTAGTGAATAWTVSSAVVARALGWAVVTDPQWAGGAKGDGATNDTPAFQAALDGKKTAWVPASNNPYYLATPVGFDTGYHLRGDGSRRGMNGSTNQNAAILKPATCAITTKVATTQYVGATIEGLGFEGGTTQVDLALCHEVEVTNCTFRGFTKAGLCIVRGEKNRLHRLRFDFTVNSEYGICFGYMASINYSGGQYAGQAPTTFFGTPDAWMDRVDLRSIVFQSGATTTWTVAAITSRILSGATVADITYHGATGATTTGKIFECPVRLQTSTFATHIVDAINSGGTGTIGYDIAEVYETELSNFSTSFAGNTAFTYGIKIGLAFNTTFRNVNAAGDNTTTYGFYFGGGVNQNPVLINCNGAIYSAGANAIVKSQITLIGCNFPVSNLPSKSLNIIDRQNGGVQVMHTADANGAAAATGEDTWTWTSGSGSTTTPVRFGPGGVKVANGKTIAFDNAYGSGSPQTVSVNSGTPEGGVTAIAGSVCISYTGTSVGAVYLKATGTGNTGWRQVYTVAATAPTVASAATDAATTQTLANDLRAKLIALGLVQ